MIDFDDKDVGIIMLGLIAIVSLIVLGSEGTTVASGCVGGISGIVTGRFLKGNRE